MPRSLFRQLLVPLASGSALLGCLFLALSLGVMARLYDASNERALGQAASALAAALPPERAELKEWTARVARDSGLRVTVIAADGGVLADSFSTAPPLENHAGRSEVAAALSGRVATAKRRSATVGRELLYAAAPIRPYTGAQGSADGSANSGAISGALRVASELPALESRLGPSRWALFLGAAAICLAATVAAFFLSRRIASPLSRLSAAAGAYASSPGGGRGGAPEREGRGALTPFPDYVARGPEELLVLARSLEAMARELAREADEAGRTAEERTAILDAMCEAVLALDGEERILIANPAAASLFGFQGADEMLGRPLLAATRSTELEALLTAASSDSSPHEAELALYSRGEAWYQVFAAPFPSRGGRPGTVLVLNDVTRLRRLERVRRDFVANVSHELRTPIQLIKGFCETLREGGKLGPEEVDRYLAIVERNAQRMESLIEDLLSLARLEQEGNSWLKRESHGVSSLVEEAVAAIGRKAEAKGIAIARKVPPDLRASVNEGLVVEALVNLLDNAVKYSPAGTTVSVCAKGEEGRRVSIAVQDQGIGIPKAELPRVFERFYRVDKARSRELGGTGLGLSIVRHVALAHGGEVDVESWEGEGSRFTIHLPVDPPNPPGSERA
jgi:two-component system phosphate regulon sensor histidine kinase PhoR